MNDESKVFHSAEYRLEQYDVDISRINKECCG